MSCAISWLGILPFFLDFCVRACVRVCVCVCVCDFSSPTRDRTHALSSERGVLTTGPPGNSQDPCLLAFWPLYHSCQPLYICPQVTSSWCPWQRSPVPLSSRPLTHPHGLSCLIPKLWPLPAMPFRVQQLKDLVSGNKDADVENGLEDTGRGKGKLGQSERVVLTYIHYQM